MMPSESGAHSSLTTDAHDVARTCRDCGATFTIPPDEQAFMAEKGYQLPKRCRDCRRLRRRLEVDVTAPRVRFE
jgi:Probable zinc-ribbon domain